MLSLSGSIHGCVREFTFSLRPVHQPTIDVTVGVMGMDDYQDEFGAIESAAAEKRGQQSRDDLASELRGDEVGRIGRFLSEDARQELIARRDGKPSKFQSALELALAANATYAAIHAAAVDETQAAQRTAQAFQDDFEVALSKVRSDIGQILDEAVTLPDGRKAFMYEDGVARTVDGEPVDSALVEGIDWSGRPKGEIYQGLLAREESLENASHRGRQLSNRLGEIENELHDEDDPPSAEQMEAYRLEVQEIGSEYDALGSAIRTSRDLERDFAPQSAELTADAVPKL